MSKFYNWIFAKVGENGEKSKKKFGIISFWHTDDTDGKRIGTDFFSFQNSNL
jgi:hypothetical protein